MEYFSDVRDHFKCMMKIVKETYGSSSSTLLTLYYVIFTENQQVSQIISSHVLDPNDGGDGMRGTKNSGFTGLGFVD